ncbi:hypothetical protein HF876_04435 [Psychrobacillus sp. BL-248-WT-3]|nr:hypothetical protein [Psychrobacillus sp. BL-248-WT-3]
MGKSEEAATQPPDSLNNNKNSSPGKRRVLSLFVVKKYLFTIIQLASRLY